MSQNKWLIRDLEGLIHGPFSTREVVRKIQNGDFSGEEMISLFPGGQWKSLSQEESFYDVLLDQLSGSSLDENEVLENSTKFVEESDQLNHEAEGFESKKDDQKSDFHQKDPNFTNPGSILTSGEEPQESIKSQDLQDEAEKVGEEVSRSTAASTLEDIELKKVSQIVRNKKILRGGGIVLLSFVMVLGMFLFLTPSPEENYIVLLAPEASTAHWSQKQKKNLMGRALAFFERDSIEGYLQAENSLVHLLEGDPQNKQAFSLLCVSYYHLWPFTKQDEKSFGVINKVMKRIGSLDAGGVDSSVCRISYYLIKSQFKQASRVVDSVLEQYSFEQTPPVLIYYFKSLSLFKQKDYIAAKGYASSAKKLWPEWLRLYVLEALAAEKSEDQAFAAKQYAFILKKNPHHKEAWIRLGNLEVMHYRHFQRGESYLSAALKLEGRVSPSLEAMAYKALAVSYESRGYYKKALKLAKKCYKAQPTSASCKQIILKYGGKKELLETKVRDQQYLAEGDRFRRAGDCETAQAHYKTAYNLNHKNAIAAFRAAECLWELNLSVEAIKWLNKAIQSDYKFISAYVLLADYYSRRFNFDAAAQVLKKAYSISPKNYEIYKGFALVELRRHFPQGALSYINKALALYPSDIDSQVLKAKILWKLKKYPEAYALIAKVVELDPSNRQAQSLYVKIVNDIQGVELALEYLTKLIRSYPSIIDYQILKGELLLQEDRLKEAEETFLTLANLQEKPKRVYMDLAETYIKMKKPQKALYYYIKAASADPADPKPLFKLGVLYLDLNQPGKAKNYFLKVKMINRRYPLVNFYLGKAALQMQSLNEALEYSKEESALNPDLADSYLLSAEIYYKMRRYQLCAREYQRAVKLRPLSADIYVKMARCYRLSGQIDAAIDILGQAQAKESGYPDIYRELGDVLKQKGESSKAIEAYQKYLQLAPAAIDRASVEQSIRSLGGGI
ncbi:MAG: hypothetical protein D6797_07520 [Bdellovibrio sp.]|nr:MAG: hypothetical protein D6797_07520 [Bdellovibrio sp.]